MNDRIPISHISRRPNFIRIACAGLAAASLGLSTLPADPPPGNWTPVFADEFDQAQLDTAVWNKGMVWAGIINNEKQAYDPDNVTLSGGYCNIKLEKRPSQMVDMYGYRWGNISDPTKPITFNYASGAIQTYNKWRQAYGYFEARVKMPSTKGSWPAFWLLPDRGPAYPNVYARTALGTQTSNGTPDDPSDDISGLPMGNEIDIFEHMATWENASGQSQSHHGYFYGPYGTGASFLGYGKVNDGNGPGDFFYANPDGEFHTYGLYWSPEEIRYYVDGVLTLRRSSPSTIGATTHYILFNCAITLNDWTGTPVTQAQLDGSLPGLMQIDYFRVWSGAPFTQFHEAELLAVAGANNPVWVSEFSDSLAASGKGEKYAAAAVGDWFAYTVPVAQAGDYRVTVRYKTNTTRGIFQLAIDDANQGSPQDQYASPSDPAYPGPYVEKDMGTKTFATAGNKTVKFTVTGKNPASTGRDLSVDYIKIEPVAPGSQVTMDSENANGVALTQTWSSSTSVAGWMGQGYLHDGGTLKGSKAVRYTPPLTAAGNYQISLWFPAYNNRSTNVPVDIMQANGTVATYILNQTETQYNGQWRSIGTYSLSPANASVTIRTTGTAANTYVVADGIRFTPQ